MKATIINSHQLKIITWNCQGAFRKKADYILAHRPDILVVQECECPDRLVFGTGTPQPQQILWFGDNKHKGLGIFSYSDYRFRLMEEHTAELKIISPLAVTGGKIDFTLFAIWANNRDDPDGQYVEQIWKALAHYDPLLTNGPVILTGDFNSNTIWDRPRRIGNHTAVVNKLAQKNILSVYHQQYKQHQGQEAHPTFFLHRNKNKPYHLDYCFASASLINKKALVDVGTFHQWIAHSDHTPLITTFNLAHPKNAKATKKINPHIVNPTHIKKLLATDKLFSRIYHTYGEPPNWSRPAGFISLSKIILEQQVSLASASAHFAKLQNYIGEFTPHNILHLSDVEMRTCQISRQKSTYLRALSAAIINKEINLKKLHLLTEPEIRKQLTAIKGIGHWTTDVYLMFCMQAKDIFPIGDVALVNTVKELTTAKTKEDILQLAENWKPFRSLAAYFLWHYYLKKRNNVVK